MENGNVNVDLSAATDVVCEKCECNTFREVAFIKKVSALISPTGKEAMVPIGTFACSSCGHVNAEFDPRRRLQGN
jgi:hypothetical protein